MKHHSIGCNSTRLICLVDTLKNIFIWLIMKLEQQEEEDIGSQCLVCVLEKFYSASRFLWMVS